MSNINITLPDGSVKQHEAGVTAITKDELVDDHYGWRWHENTHQMLERAGGALTVGLGAVAYFAL